MGLVQREIEAGGFTTISLSMMPELTKSAGVPRIAAIEHPFGLTLGLPQDRNKASRRHRLCISKPVCVANIPVATGELQHTH